MKTRRTKPANPLARQTLWVLRTEGSDEGDFESTHASKESAYCAAADLLRDAWAAQFIERCPINYRGTVEDFYKSVDEAIETWTQFRNDEGAYSDIRHPKAGSVKWYPWSFSIEKQDWVDNHSFVEHQKKWFKEDNSES